LLVGSSSGLIIAFVVVVWAAYAVPLALRRYDEASKNASVETTGGLSRVISRSSGKSGAKAAPQPEPKTEAPAVTRSIDRPAARLAARRRRRTLLILLTVTAIVGGLAGFAVIAPYWVAAPIALVVAWLVACRIQVRGERGIAGSRPARSKPARSKPARSKLGRVKLSSLRLPSLTLPRIARPVAAVGKTKVKAPSKVKVKASSKNKAADEEDTVIVSGQFEDVDPGRKHQMEDVPLEVDALDDQIVIAVPSMATTGEALWDPLPVTLPTYVTKPRAGRTVRTIDFSQPHTWTSGHIEGEDVELPKRADDEGDQRRAVGH
jgi:hypothetical protein